VAQGDLVVGDADGVVVVPHIHREEERIRRIVMAGGSLAEARAAEGYHRLQRRGT
jgi:regulator of RNase E activity RraA